MNNSMDKKVIIKTAFCIIFGILIFIFSRHITLLLLYPFADYVGKEIIIIGLITFPIIIVISIIMIIFGLINLRKYFKNKKNNLHNA